MKSAQIGAKIDNITEKRHFPMIFFCKTFNYSISHIYQQITIIKMEYFGKNGQKTQFTPNAGGTGEYKSLTTDSSSSPSPASPTLGM